jgi:Acyclic terpene utilisation family protein AtuA
MSSDGEVRVLSATAILGYGYPLASLEAGLALRPDVLAVDAGSTDPGPYYLGAGTSFTGATAVRRDLEPLVAAAIDLGIPLIISSAGGAGGDPHLEWCFDILAEILRDQALRARVALIHAEQDREQLRSELRAGRIVPLAPLPPLTEGNLDRSVRIVAQMGPEPIQKALLDGAQIVLAGRSCDVSPFAALPLLRGCDPGLTIHAAKILECGAYCAEPAGASDCMLAVVDDSRFVLRALNPNRRVSKTSAAAHSLYEQPHPSTIVEPTGSVDVENCTFQEFPDGSVAVAGSRFVPAAQYTVKLEGAALVGYRSVSLAGIRDARAIANIEGSMDAARQHIAQAVGPPGQPHSYSLHYRVYGRDGVMGQHEPLRTSPAHEVGLVFDVIAETQQLADDLCAVARSAILHHDYPGRLTVGGSLALPFSPHDASWGPVFEFSVYHLWQIDDPLGPFPIENRQV